MNIKPISTTTDGFGIQELRMYTFDDPEEVCERVRERYLKPLRLTYRTFYDLPGIIDSIADTKKRAEYISEGLDRLQKTYHAIASVISMLEKGETFDPIMEGEELYLKIESSRAGMLHSINHGIFMEIGTIFADAKELLLSQKKSFVDFIMMAGCEDQEIGKDFVKALNVLSESNIVEWNEQGFNFNSTLADFKRLCETFSFRNYKSLEKVYITINGKPINILSLSKCAPATEEPAGGDESYMPYRKNSWERIADVLRKENIIS